MRNKILQNLRDGLTSYLGKNSTFEEHKVEDIQNQLPNTVTVNKFIGLTIDNVKPLSREIGSFSPSHDNFMVDIVILVRGAAYDTMKDELDIIVHRVRKYLANDIGGLNGLEQTFDSDTETVITYNVIGRSYVNGKMKKGDLGHLCTLSILVTTQTQFN